MKFMIFTAIERVGTKVYTKKFSQEKVIFHLFSTRKTQFFLFLLSFPHRHFES